MTAFIKGWVVALLRAWQSRQWVTLFRRGFAPCSIISHYYMSHLLPRIPMGGHIHTQKHTRAHTSTYRWYPASLASRIPKSQQHTLAPGQKSSHSQQPSATSTTRWLLKRKTPLNDTDETASEQQSRKLWESGEILFILSDITKLLSMSGVFLGDVS